MYYFISPLKHNVVYIDRRKFDGSERGFVSRDGLTCRMLVDRTMRGDETDWRMRTSADVYEKRR